MSAEGREKLEPTYVYVKGQGWVPTTKDYRTVYFVSSDGLRMSISDKSPEEGELYCDWGVTLNYTLSETAAALESLSSEVYSTWPKYNTKQGCFTVRIER